MELVLPEWQFVMTGTDYNRITKGVKHPVKTTTSCKEIVL